MSMYEYIHMCIGTFMYMYGYMNKYMNMYMNMYINMRMLEYSGP
jgi:hypothetical protein